MPANLTQVALSNWLSGFFDTYPACRAVPVQDIGAGRLREIDSQEFLLWFDDLARALDEVRQKRRGAENIPSAVLPKRREINCEELSSWLDGLKQPLDEMRPARSDRAESALRARSWLQGKVESGEFLSWFDDLEPALKLAYRGALLCNPWEVAGLARNEVRNSAVLAWLLNPKGSHGLGGLALNSVLEKLSKDLNKKFPTAFEGFCNVRTEVTDGDGSDRVDIEIQSHDFYLVIEVKIDAGEGREQLRRYGEFAKRRVAGRPWAIVFLTPSGQPPRTATQDEDDLNRILPISWKSMSRIIGRSLDAADRDRGALPAKGRQRVMAEQVVRQFLAMVCSF